MQSGRRSELHRDALVSYIGKYDRSGRSLQIRDEVRVAASAKESMIMV